MDREPWAGPVLYIREVCRRAVFARGRVVEEEAKYAEVAEASAAMVPMDPLAQARTAVVPIRGLDLVHSWHVFLFSE